MKFYIYQLIAVVIIWSGMTYFFNDLAGDGKLIYYLVTSWMLFIIVLAVKKYIAERKKKDDPS